MNNEVIELYKQYPLIIPNEQFTVWEGFFQVSNNSYKLHIETPNYPSLDDFSLKCHVNIRHIVEQHKKNLENKKTLLALLNSIEHIFKTNIEENKKIELCWNEKSIVKYYNLLAEIENTIGSEYIDKIGNNFEWVRFKYEDLLQNQHFLAITLDNNYPNAHLKLREIDLPDDVLSKFNHISYLAEMFTIFKDCVDELVPFWSCLDELEKNTWVVDPEAPRRRDIHRRILISDVLSVLLTFTPLKISSLPDVKFFGPLNSITEIRNIYQSNLNKEGWDENSSITENLLRLLNLDEFPRKTEKLNLSVDESLCGICYSVNMEKEAPPAKWCTNNKCSALFHQGCLLKWFVTMPGNVKHTNVIFDYAHGPCPYCKEKIQCPIEGYDIN